MQGAANGAVSNSAVPGGFPVFMRTNMPPPLPFFMMDAADASPDVATGFDRGRSEPFEPLGSLQAPSNPAASSSGPNVQALLPASATVNGAMAVPTAGVQAVSASSALPAQPAAIGDPASNRVDRPAAAVGSVPSASVRVAVETDRPSFSLGRSFLATALSHSVLLPTAGPDGSGHDRYAAGLLPRGADLIAEALPFDGDSLERGLDEFVRQLEAVDVASLVSRGPAPLVIVSVAMLSTAASALVVREAVRRRSGRGRGVRMVDHLGRELALSFPELPRSWSERR